MMRLVHHFAPLTFAFAFTILGAVVDDPIRGALYLLIGVTWMVVSKLDDLLGTTSKITIYSKEIIQKDER